MAKAKLQKAKPPRKRGAAGSQRRRTGHFFVYIAFGLLLVFSQALAALLLVGLMPTLVILFADIGAYKGPRLITMLTFNAAGVLPYAKLLLDQGMRMSDFTALIGEVVNWAVMYGAAGVGAAAIWLGPVVAAAAQQVLNADSVRKLDRRRKALIEEWGEELTQSIDA